MTAELETAMTEKESMVEDCAEAREAREHGSTRVEDWKKGRNLEMRLETMKPSTRCNQPFGGSMVFSGDSLQG